MIAAVEGRNTNVAGLARRLDLRLQARPRLGPSRAWFRPGGRQNAPVGRCRAPYRNAGHPAGSSGGPRWTEPRRLTGRRFPDPIRDRAALSQYSPAAEMASGAFLPAKLQAANRTCEVLAGVNGQRQFPRRANYS
jgi:hypothetical protein